MKPSIAAVGRLMSKIAKPPRQLGRAGLWLLRTAISWCRTRLQDVAFTLIGLGYLILSMLGTDRPPPPAPRA